MIFRFSNECVDETMSETEFARAERYWRETCKLTSELNSLKKRHEKLRKTALKVCNTFWDYNVSMVAEMRELDKLASKDQKASK